jgi:SAM-dependent methyltransferase
MNSNFKLYSKYYNLLYKDKDYNSEVNYIVEQLSKYGTGVQSILEYGSGTGGHGLLLNEKGFDVYGLERSEDMVSVAKEKGLACTVADITNFQLDKKYDALIAIFHVISYLTSNQALISAFTNAYNHLSDEGIFLFDVWYSPAVYNLKAVPRIKRIQNEELKVIRIAEPLIDSNKNMVDVQFSVIARDLLSGEVSELIESHPMRHFSIPEIGLLAEHTGFEILKVEEFLTGKAPSEKTWGVCFILKKI